MRRTQAVRQAGTSGEAAGRNEVRSSTERRRVVDDPRSITAGNSGSGAGSGSTKEKAKQQSREVAQRTRQQASRVAEEVREQVLRLAPVVDTICLHGDTPGCLEFAELVRKTLADAGYEVGV